MVPGVPETITEESLARIFEEERAWLVGIAGECVGAGSADDIVQEAMLYLMTKAMGRSVTRSWLGQLVANRGIDYVRSRALESAALSKKALSEYRWIESREPSPERAAIASEALSKVPPAIVDSAFSQMFGWRSTRARKRLSRYRSQINPKNPL